MLKAAPSDNQASNLMANVSLGFSKSDCCRSCDCKAVDFVLLHLNKLPPEKIPKPRKHKNIAIENAPLMMEYNQNPPDLTHDLNEG